MADVVVTNGEMLKRCLGKLDIVSGPDQKGEYLCWCPYHPDGKGDPPHRPNLHVSERGFKCFACPAAGSLHKLAEELEIDLPRVNNIAQTFDYQNADGTPCFQVVRKAGEKDFWQRHPDGKGGWVNGRRGIVPVIYRLPEVLAAVGQVVYVVEGEKDAERLREEGLVATTSAGGAESWRKVSWKPLADRDVVILPDNDGPGQKYGQGVAGVASGIARSVKVVELPGLQENEDVSDWLDAGHTIGELQELTKQAPAWEGADGETEQELGNLPLPDTLTQCDLEPLIKLKCTDAGNAEAIVSLYGNGLRYVKKWKRWFIYKEHHWVEDIQDEVVSMALDVIRAREIAATRLINDKKTRDKQLSWAMSSESQYRIEAALGLAKKLPPVRATPEIWDRDSCLLGVANGVVDLRTGELRSGRPDDYITLSTGIEFDPNATCPRWDRFLQEIFNKDKELINFIHRAVGYSLGGDISEQCMFIGYGKGANGKSTFLNALRGILGAYAANTPMETFSESRYDNNRPSNDVAALRAARLVTSSEIRMGRRLNVARIKAITGGDPVTARFLHKEFFTFQPEFKVWVGVNHKPKIPETSDAIWRRIRLILFNAHFPPDTRQNNLDIELASEFCGVLAWAVRGALEWRKKGLQAPKVVTAATKTYQEESDIIQRFLDECVEHVENEEVRGSLLYQAYERWCKANGEHPISGTAFGRELGEKFTKGKKGRYVIYENLRLSGETDEEEVPF